MNGLRPPKTTNYRSNINQKTMQSWRGKIKTRKSLVNRFWEGLGPHLGRVWDGLGRVLDALGRLLVVSGAFKIEVLFKQLSKLDSKKALGSILEGFGEAFGKVSEGFWNIQIISVFF